MNIKYIQHLVNSNKVVFIAITSVLVFYMSTIMMMYDPNRIDAMMSYIEALPEAMIKALTFRWWISHSLAFYQGIIMAF
jgi:hypothetical protein